MTKYYLHADLVTQDNGFVVRIGLPPFQVLPEAIQWGQRHFVLRNKPEGTTTAGQVWRYHEIFCYPALPGCQVDTDD